MLIKFFVLVGVSAHRILFFNLHTGQVYFTWCDHVTSEKSHICVIDQARGQDGWILAEFSFCVFMDRDVVEIHKNAKRELGQYPVILTELAWSIKELLYGIKSTEKIMFVHVYFRALKRKPYAKVITHFGFLVFYFHPDREITENLLLSRKIFCERKLSCTRLDFGEMLLWEQNGQSRAGSIASSCPLG